MSIHSAISLFLAGGDFEFILSIIANFSDALQRGYTILFSLLFVLAPMLTFGFVLSFFKNISAYLLYFTHYFSTAYIFSELNEKSLSLAKSIHTNNSKNCLFVFTDVYESEDEKTYELTSEAKNIGAIFFKKDMLSVSFEIHSKKKDLTFFAIGEEHSENIRQALALFNRLKFRNNTNLYVFSTEVEADVLLANGCEITQRSINLDDRNKQKIAIKVRLVNDVQALIYRLLYEKGYENIFASAREQGTGIKKINALIVGMGEHGAEMTKALSWFCQMDGYDVEINCFDKDESAGDRFYSLCPELMRYSGYKDIFGDAKYTINLNSYDVRTKSFDDKITELQPATYIFVALGNDETNIATAIKLRSLYSRLQCSPIIQAIVYDSEKKNALENLRNFNGLPYNIQFTGDIDTSYSEEVVMKSDLEIKALARHLTWGTEAEFWKYSYNYKASVASAIHKKMKALCGVAGFTKKKEERTLEETTALRILEHCRWNAYMRSEGYIYGEKRNDIAKTHNCLVPFEQLPLAEQQKDDF